MLAPEPQDPSVAQYPAVEVKNPGAVRGWRIGQYLADVVARQGGTALLQAVARVLGSCFGHATERTIATEYLRQRTQDRGVLAGRAWSGVEVCPLQEAPPTRVGVSYGTVANVLGLLRRAGAIDWPRAHVRRWHGDSEGTDALVPERNAAGDWRLPIRRLRLVGVALAAGGGLALGLRLIEAGPDCVKAGASPPPRASASIRRSPRASPPPAASGTYGLNDLRKDLVAADLWWLLDGTGPPD